VKGSSLSKEKKQKLRGEREEPVTGNMGEGQEGRNGELGKKKRSPRLLGLHVRLRNPDGMKEKEGGWCCLQSRGGQGVRGGIKGGVFGQFHAEYCWRKQRFTT